MEWREAVAWRRNPRKTRLACCRVWFSVDRELSAGRIPPNVWLAYVQVEQDEEPEMLDLRSAVRKLRMPTISLPMLGPHERGTAENCGDCGKCFR